MDKETLEQFQLLIEAMGGMEQRLSAKIEAEVTAAEQRQQLYLENTVTKKIEALFDGYKLTHEKQWELERRVEDLERRVEELLNRIA